MPIKDGSWDYSTVVEGVPFLLDLFDEFDVCSTFFVSSDVAENAHGTVKEIMRRGHEVGCHGYNHQPLKLNDKEQQFVELQKATKIIQDNANTTVVGFRAPFCRISESTIPILIKLGYKYDSSVVPSLKLFSKYYFPKAPREPYRPSKVGLDKIGDCPITEIPVSTLPLVGLPLGLSYCMLFGLGLYKSLLLNFNQKVMTLFIHNYDIYPIPSEAKVSRIFRLPYIRRDEKRVMILRELLTFLKERVSPSFRKAKETLDLLPDREIQNFPRPQNF